MAFCMNCRTLLEADSKFCATCGTRAEVAAPAPVTPAVAAPPPAFCSQCGTRIEAGCKFCAVCGKTAVPPPPVQAQEQPQAAAPPVTPTPGQAQQQTVSSTSPWGYFTGVLQKYAVFKGRARRAEYWWCALIYSAIYIACFIIDNAGGLMFTENYGVFSTVFMLAVLLPIWGCMVRRFHDRDKRAWWCLVPVYNIVLLCKAGTTGQNRFGTDPKASLKMPAQKKTTARNILIAAASAAVVVSIITLAARDQTADVWDYDEKSYIKENHNDSGRGGVDYEKNSSYTTYKVRTLGDVTSLRLRDTPSFDSNVIDLLSYDSFVDVLETGRSDVDNEGYRGNWVYVRTPDGKTGWCFGAHLQKL